MAVIFYRLDEKPKSIDVTLPENVQISFWAPHADGPPKDIFAGRANRAWALMNSLGLFARRDFTAVVVHEHDRLLHRLIVTPKWYRFPDMGRRDLQIGLLWTDPAARGQGFASAAIEAVHRRFAGNYDKLWYLVEDDNTASRALIEKFGYRLAGEGSRTSRLGLRLFGQFKLDRQTVNDAVA